MFSENDRITSRQCGCIIALEQLPKLCLFLPVYLSAFSAGSMAAAMITGTVIWILWVKKTENQKKEENTFFPAWYLSLLEWCGILFYCSQAAVCLYLSTCAAKVFLLPQLPAALLILFPFAAGWYLSARGCEIMGRVSEILVPLLFAFIGIMVLVLAVSVMNGEVRGTQYMMEGREAAAASYEVFALLGGLFLPVLFQVTEKRETLNKKTGMAAAGAMVTAGSITLLTALQFGTKMGKTNRFFFIRVMTTAGTGEILQRWDIWFFCAFMMAMAVSIGISLWFAGQLSERLGQRIFVKKWNENKNRVVKAVWRGMVLIGALGFSGETGAFSFYRAWNLWILTPVLLVLMMAGIGRKQKKTALIAAAVLLAFLSGGCTAREPEQRIFPLAMEIRKEDEQLEIRFAWKNAGQKDGEPQKETIAAFRGKNLEEVKKKIEAYSDRKTDYSLVKAIIMEENLQKEKQLWESIVNWLEEEAEFSAGIVVYPARKSALTLERASAAGAADAGSCLEHLYESQERFQKSAFPLAFLFRGKVL